MKTHYRLIRRGIRGGLYYCVDTKTGKRTSLGVTDEDEARQIIEARNNSKRQPALNLQIARSYLIASDPAWLRNKFAGNLPASCVTASGNFAQCRASIQLTSKNPAISKTYPRQGAGLAGMKRPQKILTVIWKTPTRLSCRYRSGIFSPRAERARSARKSC